MPCHHQQVPLSNYPPRKKMPPYSGICPLCSWEWFWSPHKHLQWCTHISSWICPKTQLHIEWQPTIDNIKMCGNIIVVPIFCHFSSYAIYMSPLTHSARRALSANKIPASGSKHPCKLLHADLLKLLGNLSVRSWGAKNSYLHKKEINSIIQICCWYCTNHSRP